MRVILAGGGTGGHINPAIAIANKVCEKYKDAEILFVGTKRGLETKLVPNAGYKIEFVEAQGLKRSLSLKNIKVVFDTFKGVLKSKKIIKKFKPDIVIGTGGYVSGPVVLAAHLCKIPTMIHEQNALAGVTSKMLSGMVDKICVAFNDLTLLGKPEKTVFTGNPIRAAFKTVDRASAKNIAGAQGDKPFILCMGGSLGAKKFNECIVDFVKLNPSFDNMTVVIVTGERYYDEVLKETETLGNPNIVVKKYVYDMENYLGAADLVISRSGAISLSEIAFMGKPSVLVPSPNVAENHQEFNADMFVKAGCAVKILESELSGERIKNVVEGLVSDKAKLEKMADAAFSAGVRDADDLILAEAEKVINNFRKKS